MELNALSLKPAVPTAQHPAAQIAPDRICSLAPASDLHCPIQSF